MSFYFHFKNVKVDFKMSENGRKSRTKTTLEVGNNKSWKIATEKIKKCRNERKS